MRRRRGQSTLVSNGNSSHPAGAADVDATVDGVRVVDVKADAADPHATDADAVFVDPEVAQFLGAVRPDVAVVVQVIV
ncbi:MAG TPA: hypothetical protein VGK29_02935 [Paludibaculum sp.]|jgi:hypothetical protein